MPNEQLPKNSSELIETLRLALAAADELQLRTVGIYVDRALQALGAETDVPPEIRAIGE